MLTHMRKDVKSIFDTSFSFQQQIYQAENKELHKFMSLVFLIIPNKHCIHEISCNEMFSSQTDHMRTFNKALKKRKQREQRKQPFMPHFVNDNST